MFAPLKKYAQFSGRARRKEYWLFQLLLIGIYIVLLAAPSDTTLYIAAIAIFALFLPGLAVSVRRLHDIGKSGWWIFIGCVPLIGGIWSLILMATAGDMGPNLYGDDPKDPEIGLPKASVL